MAVGVVHEDVDVAWPVIVIIVVVALSHLRIRNTRNLSILEVKDTFLSIERIKGNTEERPSSHLNESRKEYRNKTANLVII